MTIEDLKTKLDHFPNEYKVELYSDENVDGIAIYNTSGKISTIEEVIEI